MTDTESQSQSQSQNRIAEYGSGKSRPILFKDVQVGPIHYTHPVI